MKFITGMLWLIVYFIGVAILGPMTLIGDLGRALSTSIFEPILDALEDELQEP